MDGQNLVSVLFELVWNNAGTSREVMREHFEHAGRQSNQSLNRRLGTLATIARRIAPVGFNGDSYGNDQGVQSDIGSRCRRSRRAFQGGISEALLTTAAGLAVGIPTLIIP